MLIFMHAADAMTVWEALGLVFGIVIAMLLLIGGVAYIVNKWG